MSKSFSTSFSSPNLMKSVPKVCRMRKKKTNKQANKQKIWRSFQLNDSMTSDWILAIPQFYSHWVIVVSLGGHLSKGMTHLCLSYEYPGSNHLMLYHDLAQNGSSCFLPPPKKSSKSRSDRRFLAHELLPKKSLLKEMCTWGCFKVRKCPKQVHVQLVVMLEICEKKKGPRNKWRMIWFHCF